MRYHLLALSLLGAFSAPALADTLAPVTTVVLYPGSATVTRSAQVAAGATEIVIGGLPANFSTETMRVQAPNGIRLGEVVLQEAASSEVLNPAEAELGNKIQALKDQQAVLQAEYKSAEIVKSYLERLGGPGTGERAPGAADPKALAGVLDTIGRGATDALLKIQKLTVQQRELGKKVDALERDLARLQGGANSSRRVTIKLAAAKAGVLTLSYQLNNAGWKPGYRASLDSAASKVDLERLATIAQNTGEDWSNVKLSLSTSQPRQSPVGREPQPWLLSYKPPQPPQEVRTTLAYASNTSPMALAPPAPPAPVSDMARRVEITGSSNKASSINGALMAENLSTFATEFEVPGKISLNSDGREISVVLSAQSLPVKQHLRVTPRLERFAIVMAEAPRPEGVWPSGNMQLFRDGSYVGATNWTLQEGAQALFAFGRDDLVKVSLDKVEGMSGSKGIFGGRASRNSADVFTLVNSHKSAVEVLVLESGPVATSEEVKVEARFEPKPSIESWEKKRGVVAWKKTLAPAETAKFQVEYLIDYPKEGTLYGTQYGQR